MSGPAVVNHGWADWVRSGAIGICRPDGGEWWACYLDLDGDLSVRVAPVPVQVTEPAMLVTRADAVRIRLEGPFDSWDAADAAAIEKGAS